MPRVATVKLYAALETLQRECHHPPARQHATAAGRDSLVAEG